MKTDSNPKTNNFLRKSLKILVTVLAILVAIPVFIIVFLSVTEYRPKPVEKLKFTSGNSRLELSEISEERPVSLMTWNIGYAGLGKYEDFFMDDGIKVRPDSKKIVDSYFDGIKQTLKENPADINFFQEIDINSKRSWHTNQVEKLKENLNKQGSFAYNFNCLYVPFPLPTIGRVQSGVAILSNYEIHESERISLPVPFKWPVRLGNLKRCVITQKIPVYENGKPTGKSLVLANFHLEAFDSGEGKIAQTKRLKEILTKEYEQGNYVIAGGDFNQRFPGSTAFPPYWTDGWLPGQLELSEEMLAEGWSFAFDDTKPTCRSNAKPYIGEKAEAHDWQYHVIDGFLLSPNVKEISIHVIDENFENSDHNPVYMEFALRK